MKLLLITVVFAIVLTLLGVVAFIVIRYWQGKGIEAGELEVRQSRVRTWATLACWLLMALTITYWRIRAPGILRSGPGYSQLPLAAIICLEGIISVRMLWFLASSPVSWFRRLNSVSSIYRVSLQALFCAIITFVTLADLKNSDSSTVLSLVAYGVLVSIVGVVTIILGWQLPENDHKNGTETRSTKINREIIGTELEDESTQFTRRMGAPHNESVFMRFDFPEEVKVPCEQYLLYFGQFLKDLGVEVSTALTQEAGHVLFFVTPADKTEALDKIRSALDLYLHLPSSPVSDTANESIAVQRLEATIHRLISDLKLAAAELQAKNATIQAQNTTIQAQQLIISVQKGQLSGAILIDSLKDATPKPEDKEDVIRGIVALGTLEGKGVIVNLGELFRRLKKLFARNE